jgi:hypothetical protein
MNKYACRGGILTAMEIRGATLLPCPGDSFAVAGQSPLSTLYGALPVLGRCQLRHWLLLAYPALVCASNG